MPSLNKVFLMGNLTRDPDQRSTPQGAPITQFGLAVNRRYRDKSGEMREDTVFVEVETWGRQAEVCGQYLAKGRCVLVEGRLRLDQWTSKAGEKRSRLKIVAERVQFLDSLRGGKGRQEKRPEEQSQPQAQEQESLEPPDGDFPF